MPTSATRTIKNRPRVPQFAVFLENKVGRLLDLVKFFSQHNIHILAISIIDTTDSAIARIVVDDPDQARTIFHEQAYAFSECNLLAVELNSATDLHGVLASLMQAECNVHFVYSFLTRPNEKSALALHVEDNDLASSVLTQSGYRLLGQKDISR